MDVARQFTLKAAWWMAPKPRALRRLARSMREAAAQRMLTIVSFLLETASCSAVSPSESCGSF